MFILTLLFSLFAGATKCPALFVDADSMVSQYSSGHKFDIEKHEFVVVDTASGLEMWIPFRGVGKDVLEKRDQFSKSILTIRDSPNVFGEKIIEKAADPRWVELPSPDENEVFGFIQLPLQPTAMRGDHLMLTNFFYAILRDLR